MLDKTNQILLVFFNQHGFDADIPALRKLHSGLTDFETWLARTGKAKLLALFNTQPRFREGERQ
jgi:hypothetical protein